MSRDEKLKLMEERMKDMKNSPRWAYENSNMPLEEFQKQYYGKNVKWK